jgi:hypothetical protein
MPAFRLKKKTFLPGPSGGARGLRLVFLVRIRNPHSASSAIVVKVEQGVFCEPHAVPSLLAATDKNILRMRRDRKNRRIEELQAVAEEEGIAWRRPGRGGSHVIFSASGVRQVVPVPLKRPVKPIYLRQFPALTDAAGEVGK